MGRVQKDRVRLVACLCRSGADERWSIGVETWTWFRGAVANMKMKRPGALIVFSQHSNPTVQCLPSITHSTHAVPYWYYLRHVHVLLGLELFPETPFLPSIDTRQGLPTFPMVSG